MGLMSKVLWASNAVLRSRPMELYDGDMSIAQAKHVYPTVFALQQRGHMPVRGLCSYPICKLPPLLHACPSSLGHKTHVNST